MTKDTANNGKRRFIGEHSAGERITKHMHGASGAALSYACFEGIFIDDLAEIIRFSNSLSMPNRHPRTVQIPVVSLFSVVQSVIYNP